MAVEKKTSERKKSRAEDDGKKLHNDVEEKATADSKSSEEEKIEEIGEEVEKTVPLDRFLRLQAEFDNYRKRVEKEKKDIIEYSNEEIIKKMLDVLDNFERAFQSLEDGGSLEEFREGMKKIYKLFHEILEKEGLSEIAETDRFNPYLHDAMMQEIKDDLEDETVTEVFQKGYRLGSRVIRPAKVKVSRRQ